MSKEPRQENNEFLLEGNMLPGEQILWQSGTGRFKLLSGANGRSILIKWAITVAVTLGIIGTYAAAATEFRSNVVVVLLIIMGLIILSPVMECSNLRGQQYILTNQRAVLIRGDRRIFSMPIQAIDDARIVQVSPNETCLLLGSKITGEPQKQLRFWAAHPLALPRTERTWRDWCSTQFRTPIRLCAWFPSSWLPERSCRI